MPLALQAHLLRFLQEGTITRLGSHDDIKLDVRVIAATHRNLADDVSKGTFREDLYYRLNVVPITMPALRERQDDIPILVDHFVSLHAKQHNLSAPEIDENQYRALLDYHWPGNVRELSNRIERFVLLGDTEELTQLAINSANTGLTSDVNIPDISFPEQGYNWEQFEQYCLQQALETNQGNKTKAAKYLKMSYKAFLYRLEKYQIN